MSTDCFAFLNVQNIFCVNSLTSDSNGHSRTSHQQARIVMVDVQNISWVNTLFTDPTTSCMLCCFPSHRHYHFTYVLLLPFSPYYLMCVLLQVNSSRSAYACFDFESGFFTSYTVTRDPSAGSQADDGDAVCCKTQAKSCLATFRSLTQLVREARSCFLIP